MEYIYLEKSILISSSRAKPVKFLFFIYLFSLYLFLNKLLRFLKLQPL